MRQALVGLPVQGEETRSRHAHDTQVQVVVSASKGTELRQTGLGGCFVYGGLRRPPRVGRGHMRASERGRRGSREGLWGPCPRQREQQRPQGERLACWRAGPREAGLAGVWSWGEVSGKGWAQTGPSKWLSVTREDVEQRRADTVYRLREPLQLPCGRRTGRVGRSPGRGWWLGWVPFVEAAVVRRVEF